MNPIKNWFRCTDQIELKLLSPNCTALRALIQTGEDRNNGIMRQNSANYAQHFSGLCAWFLLFMHAIFSAVCYTFLSLKKQKYLFCIHLQMAQNDNEITGDSCCHYLHVLYAALCWITWLHLMTVAVCSVCVFRWPRFSTMNLVTFQSTWLLTVVILMNMKPDMSRCVYPPLVVRYWMMQMLELC